MKICFLSLGSYSLLTGKNVGYGGGAEVEQFHLGSELAARGFEVSFVTYRHSQNSIEEINGIKLLPTYNRDDSKKKNPLEKLYSVLNALKKANADLYFYEAGSSGAIQLFCRINNRKFVYRIPSDATVLGKRLSRTATFGEKLVDTLDIKNAIAVIAQSNFQRDVLRDRFNVECIVIKNGLSIPPDGVEKSAKPVVLWVGTISRVKNPEIFVKLAKSLPNIDFEMVGGSRDNRIYNYVVEAAKSLPNFKYSGFVAYSNINEYFRRASMLVNTSSIEGFSNTFIQAWANRTPVVSLNVDPDGIIKKESIGFHSCTFDQLVKDVSTLTTDKQLCRKMGEKARRYIEKEHDIKTITKKYIKLFADVV